MNKWFTQGQAVYLRDCLTCRFKVNYWSVALYWIVTQNFIVMQLTASQTNLFLLLFLATILHSFFLATLLLGKARKERGIIYLSIVLLLISLMMLSYVLYLGNWMEEWPHLLGVFAPFAYLMGPAYYFFIKRSISLEHRFKWWDSFHLLPFFYVLIQWMSVYGMPAEAKLQLIERAYEQHSVPLGYLLLSNMHLVLVLLYAGFSGLLLKKYAVSKVGIEYRRKWLMHFTQFFGLFLLVNMCIQVIFWSQNWDGAIMELSLVLIFAVAIHILGYHILGRDQVMPAFKIAKYAHSPLSIPEMNRYQQQILDHLDQKKPWINAGFSLDELSKALDIPRHHISQVLNEGLRLSFHDLISQYRVELFKQRLLAGGASQYSIHGMAMDCGFGSKSSFNRTFKRIEGCTPSQWIKDQQAASKLFN